MAPSRRLPATIRDCLNRLRQRIRRYVWFHGLVIAIAWLGLAYWIGLGLDYLPVLAGSSEMPRGARITLLVVISVVLVWILFHWIVRRAFVPITDSNLAVLLERRFPHLGDALLTAIGTDRGQPQGQVDDESNEAAVLRNSMIHRAVSIASDRISQVDPKQVLDHGPLLRGAIAAVLAALSVVMFGIFARDACATWTSRLLLLTDAPWPRRAAIQVLDFSDKTRKVAEGSDVTIRVRADNRQVVPEVCRIDYALDDGGRGRVNMSRDGEARGGYQYYRYEGPPFQGMLDSIQFDVVGFDHRVSDYEVQIVPSPSIVGVDMDCELPAYMNAARRRQTWVAGTSLPIGTRISLSARATKPLKEFRTKDLVSGEVSTMQLSDSLVSAQRTLVNLDLGTLNATKALEFELLDMDLVTSDQPYRVTITAVEDVAPQLEIELNGIGTAITPNARLPMTGSIRDDYGIRESWFQIAVAGRDDIRRVEIEQKNEGDFDHVLDLRQQRSAQTAWETHPGDKITVGVRATDEYDLAGEPHLGQSDDFPLDVVKPAELLALLEARELGLKERFEQAVGELKETRDSLLRLQAELSSIDGSEFEDVASRSDGSETASTEEPNGEIADNARLRTIRQLRVQRAAQQGSKSHQEVAGVGESFDDIRMQLVNNRVDTPERNARLEQHIIDPIQAVVAGQFPFWLDHLNQLEQQLDDPTLAPSLTREAVTMANDLIVSLEQILQSMLELETYNELVDLVRSILDEQERLHRKTAEEGKRQARGLLED